MNYLYRNNNNMTTTQAPLTLTIEVPDDDNWNSPSPSAESRNEKFEQASAAFDKVMDTFSEEGWDEDAPNKYEYSGKRSKTGMPDKRTKAGKAWYRERDLSAEILKATDPYSINCV